MSPQSGRVFADDTALSELDLRKYRGQVGVVMQDPMVFGGSVSENIAYGDSTPDMEKVKAAARVATADSFVNDLTEGYETTIGDEGIMLSGGQKQKISIARAVYDRPRLLILDEPTNHLDSTSVDEILQNLISLQQKPSVIIISHDARVLKRVDELYHVEDGHLRSVMCGKAT